MSRLREKSRSTRNAAGDVSSLVSDKECPSSSNFAKTKGSTRNTDSASGKMIKSLRTRDRGGCSVVLRKEETVPVTSAASLSKKASKSKCYPVVSENVVPPEPTTIHSLMEELLIEVFQYLGHGDRKTARSVNKTWCKAMSNWSGYNNNVVFVVKGGTESRSVLKETEVPWKKIRVEKFRLNEKGYGNFSLPTRLANVVTSVEFSKSIVSWDGIQHVLAQFQTIEEVNIIQCKRKRKETTSPVALRMTRGTQHFQENLVDILKNVISIRLELRKISDMIFYLSQFNKHGVSGLANLSIKEVYDGGERVSPCLVSDVFEAIFVLVQRSSRTMKSLRIHFVTPSLINVFYIDFVTRVGELNLDLHVFEVNGLGKEPNDRRDFEIYSAFIQSQKNLVEVRLPKPGDTSVACCRTILQAATKNLRRVHFPSDKYINCDFLEQFTNLRQIGCDFEMRPFLLSGRKYRKIRCLEMQEGLLCSTIPLIVDTFPNLTKLNINGNSSEDVPPMDDSCLQTIIRNLKHLQVLIFGSCDTISDYGVTGISRAYCEKLFRSRSICLDPGLEVPKEEILGYPLSSLKGLTSLTFSEKTAITDVGIYYGFGFQELRSLNMRNNPDISDWGLDMLGQLNRNLESLYMGFGLWVTKVGLQSLRSRLCKIKRRNAIYVWPCQEYYSSDESYAMESEDDDF